MRVTMILPALTEATSPLFRPIKYALFPPLGLATLAGYLRPDDDVRIIDEHVERLRVDENRTDDDRPDLVVIQPYITSARRSYRLADAYRGRGVHVAMGGLHVTSLPEEAAAHADTIFVGPGRTPGRCSSTTCGAGGRAAGTTRRTEPSPGCRRWKKFEPLWDLLIRSGQVLHALPLLEAALGSFGARRSPVRRPGGEARTRGRSRPEAVAFDHVVAGVTGAGREADR